MTGLGASYLGDGRCRFRLWAPGAVRAEVHLLGPGERMVPMRRAPRGYHVAEADPVAPGTRYRYRLDGREELPDPASRHQPEGVHGPSAVVDPAAHAWRDGTWRGPDPGALILYECHVGTFTDEGTFAAIIPRLPDLVRLGVTALELMPVAQFPGARNWGYDGVYPLAVQDSYGGPEGLCRLVDACHGHGLAVVLDVVYNHLGPEGNYLPAFGPYFMAAYRTPWGAALNFDGPDSDEVRRLFRESAVHWVREYHVDGLRLDAVHAILDRSPRPFLAELAAAVRRAAARAGRRVVLIAESDANDPRLLRPPSQGGLGLDAVWSDDFHHALHALLTGERDGYYADFGDLRRLAAAYAHGFAFTGQRSRYRRRRHGAPPTGRAPRQFVVFAQNHDQVGNRAVGERLGSLVGPDAVRLAAAAVLLSPFTPLLFMGEEHAERAPFLYFTSHGDPALAEAVRDGRRRECAAAGWAAVPPDPQAEATFARSRPAGGSGGDRGVRRLYAELIRLRGELGSGPARVRQVGADTLLVLRAGHAVALHFGSGGVVPLDLPAGRWRRRLDTADVRWGGPGAAAPAEVASAGACALAMAPRSCAVYARVGEEG